MQRLDEVIPRLTPEQYSRLVSFAESLASEGANYDESSAGFSDAMRARLRELTLKSKAESLSEEEHAEYVALAEDIEDCDAQRLEAAANLSDLNNIPLAQALAQIDAGANGRG